MGAIVLLVVGTLGLAATSSGSSPRTKTTTTASASTATTSVPPTTAPTTGTTTPSTTETIAVEGPMTGPQSAIGQDMLRGAQLAAASINAGGGVLGRLLVVTSINDGAPPRHILEAARQAVAQHVAAVIGPFSSAVGVQVLPIYKRARIPILRLTSATDTQGFGVTTQAMQNQIAPVVLQALRAVLHARSLAILYDPASGYTVGVASQLETLATTAGLHVVLFRSVSATGSSATVASNDAAALAAVAAAKPAVTYLAMYGPQAGRLVAAMHLTGASDPYGRCFVDYAAQGTTFIGRAGPGASHCLASGVPPPNQLPGGTGYVTAYQTDFQAAPNTWGPFTYDSVQVLAASALHANSWAASAVVSQLAKTTNFFGVTGTITFAPGTGDRVDPPVVILEIAPTGVYGVDPAWAAAAGYAGPADTTTTTVPKTTTTTTSHPATGD